ncbi:hypothetical protein TYRP_023020 [Tyrophagus putrescentiae]|nr:hypothetical protein TYRP_023020 [Tyrophagus putrescentiae]
MSTSKEDVTAAQAPKRRATLRRWITISHQVLSAGVNPGKGHQPPITRQAVDSIGGELILHDIDNPDERVAEYVEKLREIKQFLDEQEEKQRQQEMQTLQLQAERLRVDKEAALIEQAKAKTAAATRPSGNPMRLELKIPPFDGSPSKYRRFEELFESLLIGKLTDQYAPNLSPTLANLQVLKGRLRERFEDAGRVREHVRATFEKLPVVRQSTQTNLLHQLIVAWEEGVLALQKTGTSDEQINNTYVRLMTHHLSSSVLDRCNYEDSWTALELLDALKRFHKRQLKLNEASSDSSSAPQREPKPRSHIHIAQPDPSRPKPVHHRASPLPNAGPERSPILSECAICTGSHRTIYCNSFTVEKRRELVAKKRLCTRCLGNDHDQLDCRSSYVCRCGRPHSRVLCSSLASQQSQNNSRPNSTNINLNAESDEDDTASRTSLQQTIPKTFASTDSEEEEEIFTATTTTTANNNSSAQPTSNLKYARPDRLVSYYKTVVVNINGQKVRVLLDGGGGRSAITEACANRLNLPLYAEQDLGIGGLGGKGKLTSTRLISAELCSLVSAHKLSVVLSVLPTLNGFRPAAIPGEFWEELRANGYVLTDTPDHHHEPIEIILGLEYIGYIWLSLEKLATEDICIRQSIFGWTAFGVTSCHLSRKKSPETTSALITIMSSYFESAPKEEDSKSDLTADEQQYLEKFTNEKVKVVNDRCVVQLPWLQPTNLGSNRKASLRPDMISRFAEPAPAASTTGKLYYLPHHCVLRLDKETTQMRIVYDGSAAEPGFKSLNDNLFKGVNSWNSLDLLLRFRFGQHTLIADIEKAFLQIIVDPPDRDALRFWWFNADGKPAEYRFTSVPFGTSASPFLLYACMFKLLLQMSATPEQITTIKEATLTMFSRIGMNVRKWRTNVESLDAEWAAGSAPVVKLLGHIYSTIADTVSLQVDLPLQVNLSTITKRLFSSLLARIYDPLGLVSPYIIQLRLFLRKVWQLGLDWDDPLPDDLREEALIALRDTKLINTVSLQRNVLPLNGQASKLFVYCDASKLALGAVAYSLVDGKTRLLISKSRLVRLTPAQEKKEDTIAALELDGLVMATELAHHINRLKVSTLEPDSMTVQLTQPFSSVVICSDSLINLQRLVKHPNDQRSSISLRIDKLTKLVPGAEFRHVSTKENPADLISRGCPLSDLLASPKWFNPEPPSEDTRFSEKITTSIATAVPVQSSCSCSRFANYGQALNSWRRIARVFRHIALGRILLIKYLQRQHFSAEIAALENKQQFDRSSVLRGRKCYLDEDGILRLYTRLLAGENLTLDQVKPIILPSKCHLVELFIQFEHQRLGHPGIERTMFAVRDQFFTLGARKYVHRLVSTCMLCKRLRGQTTKVDFGMVPQFRYDFGCTPFANVGLDIYGPLKTAMTTPGKRYGVIFSCATTRAVHLEPIHDQTQESVFQAVLNFMMAREVHSHRISTDNGRTHGSQKQFCYISEQALAPLNHNPACPARRCIQLTGCHLPWRGGFYERRLIRIIKTRVMALTFGKRSSTRGAGYYTLPDRARLTVDPCSSTRAVVVSRSWVGGTQNPTGVQMAGSCQSVEGAGGTGRSGWN